MISSLSAAGRLVVTLRKKKNYLTNKKNAPNVFLNQLNKKNETKYNHFAITYKTELF